MRLEIVEGRNLNAHHYKHWDMLASRQHETANPFLSPEFTRIVSAVREDIYVAMATDEDVQVYFPFQLSSRHAMPVAARLNEWQGVISSSGTCWQAEELLRALGVRQLQFDHLLVDNSQPVPEQSTYYRSPYLSLKDGFEGFLAENGRVQSAFWKQIQRKRRKLEREVGPLRFVMHDSDDICFQKLVEWKQDQHQRTGVLDLFQFPWVLEALSAVRHAQTNVFRGTMSGLWAGDHLVAVHLGMINHQVAHLWYPAYDVEFGKYSPGIQLFYAWIEELCRSGVQRMDMGPGPQRYKRYFRTADTLLAEGSLDRSPLKRVCRRRWNAVKHQLRQTPLRSALRLPASCVHRCRQWWRLRVEGGRLKEEG